MPLNILTVQLDKPRKIYQQGEVITGTIVVENKYNLKHDGILLTLEGLVDIHFNLRSISFMDTFYGSNKSIVLVDQCIELTKGGVLSPGKTEIPFRLTIDGIENKTTLYETYHGVFISIQYCVRCRIKRPFLTKDLVEFVEINIEYDSSPIGALQHVKNPIQFKITPDSLSAARPEKIPNFRIVGHLDSIVFKLSEPITGEFTIEKCDAIIRSVELQLVRVETCGITPGDRDYSRDATEVQNIQIGDGNLIRNVSVPIYMILPRLFTCPTLITSDFKIEFEINLVIIFEDNHLITENFPIKLIRSTWQPNV